MGRNRFGGRPGIVTAITPTMAAGEAIKVGKKYDRVVLAPLGTDNWPRLDAVRTAVGALFPVILSAGTWPFTANTAFMLRAASGTGYHSVPPNAGTVTFTEDMLFVADSTFAYPVIPTWTPLADTGLQFWGECDPINYPSCFERGTNTAIKSLVDLNGSGRKATNAIAAHQPIEIVGAMPSGLSAIRFDGVDDWLQCAFTLVQPFHFFLVVRPRLIVGSEWYLDGVVGSVDLRTSSVTAFGGNLSADIYGTNTVVNTTVHNEWQLWDWVGSGASSKLTVSGVTTTGTQAPNNPAPGGITLGSYLDGAHYWSTMDLFAILAYSVEKTGAGLTNIRTYLATKSGVS